MFLAQAVIAGANIENDRILGFGHIRERQKISLLKIGDDEFMRCESGARLGFEVRIERQNHLAEMIILVHETAGLRIFQKRDPGALNTLVGDDFVEQR